MRDRILAKAILAPSGDNMQPWKFKWSGDDLEIHAHPYSDSFLNRAERAIYISVGAVIENIRVAAGAERRAIQISYLPDGLASDLVSKVSFKAQEQTSSSHYPALDKRSTNRRFYRPWRRTDDLIWKNISKTLDAGFQLHVVDRQNKKRYRRLTNILARLEGLRFENKRIHRDFTDSLRFSKKEIEQLRDGIDARTLEGGPHVPFIMKLITPWKTLNLLNRFGFSKVITLHSKMQFRSSQALIVLSGPNLEPNTSIRAGENVERTWHELTMHNAAFQPFYSLCVCQFNLRLGDAGVWSEAQRQETANLVSEACALLNIDPSAGLFLCGRVGIAPNPKIRSLRRPLSSFMLP